MQMGGFGQSTYFTLTSAIPKADKILSSVHLIEVDILSLNCIKRVTMQIFYL
jgi:hypothetical protein